MAKDEITYICKKTIQEVHRLTNGYFDLNFVAENKTFILDNLDTLLNLKKSEIFENSIWRLSKKIG